MASQKSQWEQFEVLVAEIQKQLAPNAEVLHNQQIIGKSGRKRKLDVTVTQKVGAYSVFIVFDCKKHAKLVKMKDVEAFAGQLEDVKANLGVMVSNLGFDAGAKAVAKQKNIILQTHRKANDTDWHELVGEAAWGAITNYEIAFTDFLAISPVNSFVIQVPPEILVFDENGESISGLQEIFHDVWKHIQPRPPIGDVQVKVEGFNEKECFFIKRDGEMFKIAGFIINAKVVAKKYIINWNLSEGDVVENVDGGEKAFRKVTSRGINWKDIVRTQAGIQMTVEEYEEDMKASNFSVDLSGAKDWLRIQVKDKSAQ